MAIGIRRATAIAGIKVIGLVLRTKVRSGMRRIMKVACIIKATGMAITGKWDMITAGIGITSGVMTMIVTNQIRRTG